MSTTSASWPEIYLPFRPERPRAARPEQVDLDVIGADNEDVAEPDWVLQPVAIGPATARTADIGTGAMASSL
jgi:hypothetical protein